MLSLIGPSGCGKTTLLRSLNRLTELTTRGAADRPHPARRRRHPLIEPTLLRRRVTMVFQQPNPFPMSVFDNIAYVLREQGSRRARKKALEPAVLSALDRAGLFEEVKDNLDHPALKLSGGQQQRLCIARALAAEPEVLLLDEPCSALDPKSTQVIEDLIVKLRDDVAVVIVTHNLQQAYRVADHVAFMYLGDLVEYNSATALFGYAPRATHPGVRQRCFRLAAAYARVAVLAASVCLLAGVAAGCSTTQEKAEKQKAAAPNTSSRRAPSAKKRKKSEEARQVTASEGRTEGAKQ